MKLLVYEEDDKFAKEVVTTLRGLNTMRRTARFDDFSHLAHERVSRGVITVIDKTDKVAEFPLAIVAVSIGPDLEAILKACNVGWSDVVKLQTWKPGNSKPRPERLMCFVRATPILALLKGLIGGSEKMSPTTGRENDARRVALQLIDTLIVHREKWIKTKQSFGTSSQKIVRRRPQRMQSFFPYFVEQ